MAPRRSTNRIHLAASLLTLASVGCATYGARAAVSVKFAHTEATPQDANVYVDEEFIAPLYMVVAHGGMLPIGEHRITVSKEGFFPYDVLVKADRKPIEIEVAMEPVPD
ncbi:MAG: hypothetical protein JW751_19580 [Polyangiaceae bacterium]|nr:hypothetical protein [Polyangiaceae bacterium]